MVNAAIGGEAAWAGAGDGADSHLAGFGAV